MLIKSPNRPRLQGNALVNPKSTIVRETPVNLSRHVIQANSRRSHGRYGPRFERTSRKRGPIYSRTPVLTSSPYGFTSVSRALSRFVGWTRVDFFALHSSYHRSSPLPGSLSRIWRLYISLRSSSIAKVVRFFLSFFLFFPFFFCSERDRSSEWYFEYNNLVVFKRFVETSSCARFVPNILYVSFDISVREDREKKGESTVFHFENSSRADACSARHTSEWSNKSYLRTDTRIHNSRKRNKIIRRQTKRYLARHAGSGGGGGGDVVVVVVAVTSCRHDEFDLDDVSRSIKPAAALSSSSASPPPANYFGYSGYTQAAARAHVGRTRHTYFPVHRSSSRFLARMYVAASSRRIDGRARCIKRELSQIVRGSAEESVIARSLLANRQLRRARCRTRLSKAWHGTELEDTATRDITL